MERENNPLKSARLKKPSKSFLKRLFVAHDDFGPSSLKSSFAIKKTLASKSN